MFPEKTFCNAFTVISMEEIILIRIYYPIKCLRGTHIFQELLNRKWRPREYIPRCFFLSWQILEQLGKLVYLYCQKKRTGILLLGCRSPALCSSVWWHQSSTRSLEDLWKVPFKHCGPTPLDPQHLCIWIWIPVFAQYLLYCLNRNCHLFFLLFLCPWSLNNFHIIEIKAWLLK